MPDPPRQAPPGAGYAANRPYFVANSLDDLHGPTTGVVTLPVWLDWSPRPEYDLDNPRRLARYYEVVLREGTPEAFADYLDGATLKRVWVELYLSVRVRALWEGRFPELVKARQFKAAGFEVEIPVRSDTFARLLINGPGLGSSSQYGRVVGGLARTSSSPVGHRPSPPHRRRDDGKDERALPALRSGDPPVAAIARHEDEDFATYGLSAEETSVLRERFASWGEELLAD